MWIESERIAQIEISQMRRIMASAPADAVNMALGELAYSFPETLRAQANELLREANPGYTPNAGLPQLREAIAAYDGTAADCVCVCNGAEEALYISLFALLNPGDKVAIPDPDYPAYPALVRMMQGQILRLPFAEDFRAIDWDLWEQVLATGVKAVLLSHPSNPSGFRFNENEWSRFCMILNRHGIILILDEIYNRLYITNPVQLDYRMPEKLIRISGVSKSHLMSGWRIGWTIAPGEFTTAIVKTKQYVSTCAAWLSQKLACYALQNPELEAEVRGRLRASRDLFLQHFSDVIPGSTRFLSLHAPDASPYILLRVQDDLLECNQLVENGVITVPGRAFGELTRNWIRINFALENQELRKGLRRLTE